MCIFNPRLHASKLGTITIEVLEDEKSKTRKPELSQAVKAGLKTQLKKAKGNAEKQVPDVS